MCSDVDQILTVGLWDLFLAREVGVPVSRRLGGQLAMTLVATKKSLFFFPARLVLMVTTVAVIFVQYTFDLVISFYVLINFIFRGEVPSRACMSNKEVSD